VASVKAILSESVYSKMSQKPQNLDVIRVNGLKKIEVGKDDNTQWIVNLNAPCDVLLSNNKELLGNPIDINKIKDANFDQVFTFGGKKTASPESAENRTGLTSRASLQPER